MTRFHPAPVGAWWRSWLAWGLLVLQPCGSVRAEPSVPALLKRLDLAGYSSSIGPPDFKSNTVDARPLSLADLRGKVVVVNFWATWCLECRSEMPVLERLYRELGSQGLAVVAVNVRESTETVRHFAEELRLTFPLLLDHDGKINASYGVIGLPTTFLVGRDGRAIAYAIGPREWGSASARALFDALLAEAASRPR